jgi:hypothetical protein
MENKEQYQPEIENDEQPIFVSSSITTGSCCMYDNQCIEIKNPIWIMLYPNKINEIYLEMPMETSNDTLWMVRNHMCDKPWRILHEYLYHSLVTNITVIPLVTSKKIILHPGVVLGHVSRFQIPYALNNIKDTDEVYFSDDDHSIIENGDISAEEDQTEGHYVETSEPTNKDVSIEDVDASEYENKENSYPPIEMMILNAINVAKENIIPEKK